MHDKREHSPAMFHLFENPWLSTLLHYNVFGRKDLMSKQLKCTENDDNCYCLEGKFSRSEDDLVCSGEL